MKRFKKVDPNITKEELLRLINEGRIYTDEETFKKLYRHRPDEGVC